MIDDTVNDCWRCALGEFGHPPVTDTDLPPVHRTSFVTAWCRGWLVLVMVFCFSLAASFTRVLIQHSSGAGAQLGIALWLLILPALAYWIFVLFFGKEAWPANRGPSSASPEEEADAYLDQATKLEVRGHIPEALRRYEIIARKYPDTVTGQDAQKSLESLRAKRAAPSDP